MIYWLVLKNFSSPDSTTAAIGGHAVTDSNSRSASPAPPTSTTPTQNKTEVAKLDPEIEKKVLLVLCDISLDIPCNASVIAEHTCRMLGRKVQISIIEELLQTFENQELIRLISIITWPSMYMYINFKYASGLAVHRKSHLSFSSETTKSVMKI